MATGDKNSWVDKFLNYLAKPKKEILRDELMIIASKILDALKLVENAGDALKLVENTLTSLQSIECGLDAQNNVNEFCKINSNLIKQWNDKLEEYKSTGNTIFTRGGGGFTATSERVMINGKQNRIVYKKNGKGIGYVKMNGEFVKMKKTSHTK